MYRHKPSSVLFLFIIFLFEQCGALPVETPKGSCVLRSHDMTDPLRMDGPEMTSSEFDNSFGLPFGIRFLAGQQYRYRFISKMKVECYNIDGAIPKTRQDQSVFLGERYRSIDTHPLSLSNSFGGYNYPSGSLLDSADMMLICHECKIPKLTINITQNLVLKNKFMYLDLAGSQMTEIEANALDNFSQVNSINLEDNSLSSLPEELFSKHQFQSALQLSLQNNNFETISKSFCNVKEFDFLNLQRNRIASMQVDCKITVTNLNMSSNFITKFNLNWLESYEKLILVDLSFNNLRELTHVEASNLDSLKYLLLNDNKLTRIGHRYFRRFTGLQSLSLCRNGITSIDSEAFKDLKTLQNLDLSHNAISDIPFGIFRDLEVLKELNVAGNKLKKLSMQTFAGLTDLHYLNLSSNFLKQIASTDLLQIKLLQAVDLSNNRLQKLDAKAILSQHTVTWLGIRNNFWNCRQLLQILQYTKGRNCNVKRGVLFDVPNIHGIACSTKNLTVTSERMTFEEFLNNLSDEKEMELILSKLDSADDIAETNRFEVILNKIKGLLLLIAVLFVVDFIFQWLFRLYQARHTVTIPITTLK